MNPSALGDERRISQLLALNQAAVSITGELELEELLQRIVDGARELVGCQYAALGVLGDDGYIARFPTSGLSETEREAIGATPRGHGLLGVMLRAGRSLRIPDMSKDPRRSGFPPHHPPMTSLLGVPLFVRGRLVGDLYLTDKIGGPEFSDEDEWLVQLLAVHVATALTNSELHKQVREAQAHAEELYEEAARGRAAAEREQQRLRELEHMKDEFLSTAAHELRTPLMTIRISASMAREQVEQLAAATAAGETPHMNPRLVDLVRLLDEGSSRMQALINDLLDLTRLEQNRVPLAQARFDVQEAVSGAVKAMLPLFAGKPQPLKLQLPEAHFEVRGDRVRLEQVFVNILSNANKYSPADAPVEVSGSQADGECRITVRDHGPGVPEEERERIFEPFYRSSLHRDDRTPSTGLGLPIARTITQKHGGRLWVEPAPDGGSIFILALPIVSAAS